MSADRQAQWSGGRRSRGTQAAGEQPRRRPRPGSERALLVPRDTRAPRAHNLASTLICRLDLAPPRGTTLERNPIVTDVSAFAELVPLDHGLCVLSTLRHDGSVQASVVNAGVLPHPLTSVQVVGLVAMGGSRKLHNLRADPRATIVVRAGWQ